MSSYIPLRVRSNYSLLTGASTVDALVRKAAASGMASIALTDEGNLYGAVPFFQKAQAAGLRPILGAIAGDDVVLLVRNARGYSNLCEILTRRNLDPDGSWTDVLARCQEGLFVLTADPGWAERMAGKLDKGSLWLECRRSRGADPEAEGRLVETARRIGAGVVAAANVYFADRRDFDLSQALHAIRDNRQLTRMMESSVPVESHLRTPEEFDRLFADVPEAVEATRTLADACAFDLLELSTVFPRIHANGAEMLRQKVRLGAQKRYGQIPGRVWHRLTRECELIVRMGFADYFLVVEDIVRYARTLGAPVAGRGSGASSVVAYCLEITNVDPMSFNLPFERFLNEARDDYPDLDIDFSWRLRDQVIDYVYRRHGADHVAMIATHVTLQPRLAFREVAKAMGIPHAALTRLADRLELGLPRERWKELQVDPALIDRTVAFARRCDGFPHHVSVHCGGVVLTPGSIFHRAPLQRAAKGVVITQFDKDSAEAIGLVKLDLLGNRALSSVSESTRLVRESRGVNIDPESLSDKDEPTATLLAAGATIGVNQLESPAMRRLLRQVRPAGIRDLMKVLALIRPGAGSLGMKETFIRRRRGLEQAPPGENRLDAILKDTHGIMLYEDDALLVARALTHLSSAEADRFRRAVTKSRSESGQLALSREFLEHCRQNGVDPRLSADLWVQMAKFNSYSFCRAHAASYARIAWANAYLKANCRTEFWAGAINNNQGMYAPWVYVETAKQEGIRILSPSVNASKDEFTVEGEGMLRIGLDRIRGLSAAGRESIYAGRPFGDLTDLISRTCLRSREMEGLVLAGAVDFMGVSRLQLMDEFRMIFRTARNLRGQPTLFPLPPPVIPVESGEYSDIRRCQDEWQSMGLSTGRHPVEYVRPILARKGFMTSRDLPGRVGRTIRLCGIPAAARTTSSKDGRTMCFITLSDEDGLFEVTLFPRTYAESRTLLNARETGMLWVAGSVESEYDALTLAVDRMGRMKPA